MASFPGTKTAEQKIGKKAEDDTQVFLEAQGLTLIAKNYRSPFGEIDLIMKDRHTIVFIEVRKRKNKLYGGATTSITYAKQQKLIKTAQYFLQRSSSLPPCRFDAAVWDADNCQWLKNIVETI